MGASPPHIRGVAYGRQVDSPARSRVDLPEEPGRGLHAVRHDSHVTLKFVHVPHGQWPEHGGLGIQRDESGHGREVVENVLDRHPALLLRGDVGVLVASLRLREVAHKLRDHKPVDVATQQRGMLPPREHGPQWDREGHVGVDEVAELAHLGRVDGDDEAESQAGRTPVIESWASRVGCREVWGRQAVGCLPPRRYQREQEMKQVCEVFTAPCL